MFLYLALLLTIIYYFILFRMEQKYKADPAKGLDEAQASQTKIETEEKEIEKKEVEAKEELPIFGKSEAYSFEHFYPREKDNQLKKTISEEAPTGMEHKESQHVKAPMSAMEESTELLSSFLLEKAEQENQHKQDIASDERASVKIKL